MSERDERLGALHVMRLSEIQNEALREGMARAINLMDNIQRGLFAEMLVALAGEGELTDPWEAWDLTLQNGTRVEVKTTGPIQSWPRTAPSQLNWDIAPHSAWIAGNQGFIRDEQKKRRSDLYVFAVHDGIKPAHMSEWSFRVVKTRSIDETLGDQKSITLTSLDRQLNPQILSYSELSDRLSDTSQD